MRKLFKTYSNREDFLSDYESTLKNGGLMLETVDPVASRDTVEVSLKIDNKALGNLTGEAVYVSEGAKPAQVGVELRGDWKPQLERWVEQFQGQEDQPQKWGSDSESLQHKIREMEMHEKIKLATKGSRAERRILMKDMHYMVHPYILKNPRITRDEIAQFARMPTLTAEMVLTISGNREWMQNPSVKLSIIKNPKTPAPVVNKYIGSLRDPDLMRLAKSENVRDVVSKAARRVLASRGKTVR